MLKYRRTRGPAGPPGYPQNSVFASFLAQGLIMPKSARLPLNINIPDTTGSISFCNNCTVMLNPGHYAVYYYISAAMKKNGFIKLTPILDERAQTAYIGFAETTKQRERLSNQGINIIMDGSCTITKNMRKPYLCLSSSCVHRKDGLKIK